MPILDHYADNSPGLKSPAENAAEITPSNTADLAIRPRAIMVATTGDVRMSLGTTVTLRLVEGVPYPIRPTRIFATGTTAEGLVALW